MTNLFLQISSNNYLSFLQSNDISLTHNHSSNFFKVPLICSELSLLMHKFQYKICEFTANRRASLIFYTHKNGMGISVLILHTVVRINKSSSLKSFSLNEFFIARVSSRVKSKYSVWKVCSPSLESQVLIAYSFAKQ
jgi:hypothetical protein